MKRRAFLQFLGLSPAASVIPAATQAKLVEAAADVEVVPTHTSTTKSGGAVAWRDYACTISMVTVSGGVYTTIR